MPAGAWSPRHVYIIPAERHVAGSTHLLQFSSCWFVPPPPLPLAEGKFPPGMSARDFIRLEAADAVPDDSGWTDQETLLLLEGRLGLAAGRLGKAPPSLLLIRPCPCALLLTPHDPSLAAAPLSCRPVCAGIEKYGESWQQVAEHVGGRSAMQCVARFLQLPTEETLLADSAGGPTNHGLVRGLQGGARRAATTAERGERVVCAAGMACRRCRGRSHPDMLLQPSMQHRACPSPWPARWPSRPPARTTGWALCCPSSRT